MPGSHSPTKSGVDADPRDEPEDRRAPDSPPATSTGRGPDVARRALLVGPATAAATNGPGVIARPASSTE